MTHIEQLNRRLREALGTGRGVTVPRFAWMNARDVFYYWRPDHIQSFQRQCWADRVGSVWMLCQWRRPELTREEWWESFHGEFPYPDKGMYYAHAETALPFGMLPTSDLTQGYIWNLDQQMSMRYAEHLAAVNADVEKQNQSDEDAWFDYVADMEPAFDVWNSGTKCGVEFQVPGMRDTQQPMVTL